MKLFITSEGNYPDCYEGDSLCECIGKLFIALDDDEYLDWILEDMASFLSDREEGAEKHSKTFLSRNYDVMKMCYGYATFEEAFSE